MALFVGTYDKQSLCHVHATFEGLCFCDLRLPKLVSWSTGVYINSILMCRSGERGLVHK